MAEDTGKKDKNGVALMAGDTVDNKWAAGCKMTKQGVTNEWIARKDLGGNKFIDYKVDVKSETVKM